jgi:hypothetical protein
MRKRKAVFMFLFVIALICAFIAGGTLAIAKSNSWLHALRTKARQRDRYFIRDSLLSRAGRALNTATTFYIALEKRT